jgi:nitroreductase
MTDRPGALSEQDPVASLAYALERLLAERYSCRAFQRRPVPTATIERILELAQRTPSWCNSQPWQLHITRGVATERFRKGLFEYACAHTAEPEYPFPREYRGVYLERRRACGFQLYEAVGIARGDREASARQTMENFRLFGAPHALIVTTDEALGVYGVLDCGAWVNNFMLAARACGVASIAQAALAAHPKFTREFFGVGEDRRIVCGMSFGYADVAQPVNRFRTQRAAVSEVVRWLDE